MGFNGSDDLMEITCDGKTVYVMVYDGLLELKV